MKKKYSWNTWWFTLLVILWVIWFLLILLTWIFKVVLLELKDTKNMDYYLKSRWASEAGEELALLRLKEEKFWYDGFQEYDPQKPEWQSIMLSANPSDKEKFLPTKDVFFGYDIDSKAEEYSWVLKWWWDFQVIPLFYIEEWWKGDTKKPRLSIQLWNPNNFIWNIIWEEWWISGKWAFNFQSSAKLKELEGKKCIGTQCTKGFTLTTIDVWDFLKKSWSNYLTFLNLWTNDIKYTLETDDGESFTKPITTVYSSAKIWEIKQNIKLEIDNSQYFDVLKYSIYDYQ